MNGQGKFRALLLEEKDGKVTSSVTEVGEASLPPGEVTIAVAYSTLNYKDGMILGGLGRIVRTYPHVPGVDFAGIVESSTSPDFKPGDPVISTGFRVGEMRWGGYAAKARVKAEWLVKPPAGLSLKRAMAIGTAGLTAMFAVIALEKHGLTPDKGEVLVTGAAGGVGSIAVAVLAKLGYRVAASTGRPETAAYLKELGALTIIDRSELATPPPKPLMPERWAGTVDSVGGAALANAIAATSYAGAVAACGLAGSNLLEVSVLPFLMRGVNLLGIDSVMKPLDARREAWSRLVRDLPLDVLDGMIETVSLADLPEAGRRILKGGVRGRVVVDVNA